MQISMKSPILNPKIPPSPQTSTKWGWNSTVIFSLCESTWVFAKAEHVSRTKHVLYGLKALWLPCQLISPPPFFPELETGTLHVTGWPPAGRQRDWKMLCSWWQCFNCGLICRLFWINKCGTTSCESQMQSPTPPLPAPPPPPADTRQDVMSKNSRVNCST